MNDAEQYQADGQYYSRLIKEGLTLPQVFELSGKEPEYVLCAIMFACVPPLRDRAVAGSFSRSRIVCEIATALLNFMKGSAYEFPWPTDDPFPEMNPPAA